MFCLHKASSSVKWAGVSFVLVRGYTYRKEKEVEMIDIEEAVVSVTVEISLSSESLFMACDRKPEATKTNIAARSTKPAGMMQTNTNVNK